MAEGKIQSKDTIVDDKKMKVLFGKIPETGDKFPAIPLTDNSADVSHVIKEIFQEYIKDELPSYESARNMQITCKDNEKLKNFADNVVAMYEKHNEALKDIASVEEIMMKNHARYILKKDEIQRNALVSNVVTMKSRPIFRPLDENILQKYPLIKSNDVFYKEVHGNVELQKDEPDEYTDYLISDNKNLPAEVVFHRNIDVKQEIVKRNEKKEDQIHKWEPFSPKESLVLRYVSKPKKHLIKVEPNQIVFTSYDRGCVYEETMWVQNIGKSVARIQILPFKETSKFKLQWNKKLGGIITIASGLSIAAKVEFHCKSLDDVADELVLKIEGGKDIIVPIVAKRLPPILEALEPEITHELVLWSLEKRGVVATLDCGVALVGDSVLHAITLFNDGGDGSFWIMTEEEWTHCEVKCGSLNNVLKIPPFLFTPFFFALKSKEEITLCVLYEPGSHGLQIEHLKMLCNNCVIHSLDILADAVFFESKFISFTSLEKIFAVEVDDDFFADYYFNIGRILPNGSVMKSFYLTNESDLELQFYWKKRYIQSPRVTESHPYTLHHIPLDSISVIPSEGVLSPKSDHHFIVKCALKNGERGHYRAILSFFIENLPWKSVTKESYVRKVFVNPIHAERVDVLLNEIELWVECVPLAVMLQPCIIKITSEKLRCNDEPVLPKITLANITLEDIGFHWIPVSSPLAEPAAASVIEMLVECGTIKTKTFMPCPLKITTLSHGLLLHEIRCSINEGEKSVEMLVCAQVAEPQINSSKYILNFGSVKKNSLASQQFKISNESNTTIVWVAREYKYHFESGTLKHMLECKLFPDSGCFRHSNSVCTVDYTLDTRKTGIWISIIELSILCLSRRYRQHFILVVGDIQEPQLTVRCPPRSTAFLCPTNPLYLGIPVVSSIVLCNHSNVPGKFRWGVPLGQDIHKMRFDIKPRHGVIQPTDCMILTVLIIPLELGCISSFFIPCFVEKNNDPIVLGIRCDIKGLSVTFVIPTEVVTGHKSSSEVLVSWNAGDKIKFPIQSLPHQEEENRWTLNDQTKKCEEIHHDMKSYGEIVDTKESKEGNTYEQILKQVDYDHEDIGNIKDDSEHSGERDDESDAIMLDGKIGNMCVEDKCRLVLHFQLWESTSVMQTHVYNAEKTIKDIDDSEKLSEIELPPFHTYPLASKEKLNEGSDSSVLNEEQVEKDEVRNSEVDMQNEGDINQKTQEVVQGDMGEPFDLILNTDGDPSSSKKMSKKTEKMDICKDIEVQEIGPKTHTVKEINLKGVKVKQSMYEITVENNLLMMIQQYSKSFKFFHSSSCIVACTKFYIQNETPIDGRVEIYANNFPPNTYVKIEDIIETVHCETTFKEQGNDYKQIDKIECCIVQGNGIVVFINQQSKNLKPYDSVDVELIVYANTWGIYTETLVCNISGLPTFYIKLNVEVQGQPLSFTLAPHDIICEHPVRFGTMRYGSEPRSRSLKILNDSCVSLTVTWHIFMKERIISRDEAEKEMLFNIVLDVYSAVDDAGETSFHCQDTEDCCNKCVKKDKERREVMEMNLVPYMGKEDYTVFQILPKQSMIETKRTQTITVTFTPPDKHSFGTVSFCAYVIGFIKVSPQDTYSKGRFFRPHGKNLPPVWANLNAEVEMPSLSLETDPDDLEFFVEAASVLSQSHKRQIVTRLLIVKNNFKSPITALVDCEKPFFIKEVKTMAHRHIKVISDIKEDIVFTLLSDECAEIHVSCDIEEKYILRVQEAFWNATNKEYSREEQDNFSKKSAVIECPLQLVQPNIMEQTIKLKLFIEFPIITVSTQKIDFGPVFVGNSKWMVFEIVNQTVSNVWFNISKVYQTNEFSVKPSCGALSTAPLYGRSGLQIKVTFSPTESMSYMDYLRVQTCVPGDDHIVVIEGVGTADTKFQSDF